MMLAFIIFWIVVALIVLALVLRPRRGGDASESRLGQRGVTVAIVIVFAFGISVPALVSADNAEHKASVDLGVHLNKNEVKGRELFARSCTVCHTLAAVKSVGRIGPDLDVLVGHQIAPDERKAFVLKTILEGPAYGLGNMPADLYVGKEAEDVADFVAAVAGH
jgi:mono/diheme cytochrome c family protein